MPTNSIQLKDVQLALLSAKLRRISRGSTCQLCALTPAPLIRVDCNTSRWTFEATRTVAQKSRQTTCNTSPMFRGHIGRVIQRVRDFHGLAEVKKTWGTGLRELKAENAYVLNGGAA